MKKLILHNTITPQVLIYGGLALLMWPTMLKALGVIDYVSAYNIVYLLLGVFIIVSGATLRVYQQIQTDLNALKNYFF